MRGQTCLTLGLLLVLSSAQTSPDPLQLVLKVINDLNSKVNSMISDMKTMSSDMKTMKADIDELKKQQSGTGGQLSNIETSSKQHWNLLRALALRQIDIQGQLQRAVQCCETGNANHTDHVAQLIAESRETQTIVRANIEAVKFHYTGHTYLIFGPEYRRNWSEARKHCQRISGRMDLAIIQSAAEHQQIQNMKAKYFTGDDQFFLGSNDQATEGEWLDLCGHRLIYFNWRRDQPDNFGTENCMTLDSFGTWNDLKCSSYRPFICETVDC